MSRKANKGNRCTKCKMKDTHCICEHLVGINNLTPVSILMHHREAITTTNTGRIANFLLNNSAIHFRGLIDQQVQNIIIPDHTPLYLYPSENAEILDKELVQKIKGRIQLIVPDGSWRQARKVAYREPFLKNVQHVKLPDTSSGIFFLRRKIKDEGVSTMEAIARALGIIESPELQLTLEKVFRIMVEKTLDTRGKKLENYEQYQA